MLATKPPDGILWLTVLVATLAFVLSLILAVSKFIAYLRSRRDREYDLRNRVNDAWIKAVVLDELLPSYLAFISEQQALVVAVAVEKAPRAPAYKRAHAAFQKKSAAMLMEFQVLHALSGATYEIAEQVFEELEDDVARHCAANSGIAGKDFAQMKAVSAVEGSFARARQELVAHLREMHHQMNVSK